MGEVLARELKEVLAIFERRGSGDSIRVKSTSDKHRPADPDRRDVDADAWSRNAWLSTMIDLTMADRATTG